MVLGSLVLISHCLVEALSGCVGPLHAFRPLGPVGRVSERLSLLDALVHHHVLLLLGLGELVEVLLLLVKGGPSYSVDAVIRGRLDMSVLLRPRVLLLAVLGPLWLNSRIVCLVVSIKRMQRA